MEGGQWVDWLENKINNCNLFPSYLLSHLCLFPYFPYMHSKDIVVSKARYRWDWGNKDWNFPPNIICWGPPFPPSAPSPLSLLPSPHLNIHLFPSARYRRDWGRWSTVWSKLSPNMSCWREEGRLSTGWLNAEGHQFEKLSSFHFLLKERYVREEGRWSMIWLKEEPKVIDLIVSGRSLTWNEWKGEREEEVMLSWEFSSYSF